jgi:hypothetical protein
MLLHWLSKLSSDLPEPPGSSGAKEVRRGRLTYLAKQHFAENGYTGRSPATDN